jgi:hypothetical protein
VAPLAADAVVVIKAEVAEKGRAFAARLAEQAARLAAARAESRLRSRRGDPSRWRRASLLWPLFTKDR